MTSITKFKIVFAGDQNVGKTSVISRFMFDSYSDSSMPTIGIDFLTKTLQVENETVRLQLWDTAGQERYRALIPSYIKDADACVMILDVTAKSTFESIPKWIDFVKDTRGEEALVFLVANKTDCESVQVDLKEVESFATANGLHFYKVSAKTGQGIQTLFRTIAGKLYEKNDLASRSIASSNDTKRLPNKLPQNNKMQLNRQEVQNPQQGGCSKC